LLDLPFAVSPVVVGYMLLLLFGRTGWFAPLLRALGWQVAFAVPGMILATLFVSLPFLVRELMPVLEAFGEQYEKAAATLGQTAGKRFGWLLYLRYAGAFYMG
jgi:sulfate transport system permease protein